MSERFKTLAIAIIAIDLTLIAAVEVTDEIRYLLDLDTCDEGKPAFAHDTHELMWQLVGKQ
jgi:hypothetical protein